MKNSNILVLLCAALLSLGLCAQPAFAEFRGSYAALEKSPAVAQQVNADDTDDEDEPVALAVPTAKVKASTLKKNVEIAKLLISWMDSHLDKNTNFTPNDLKPYFAAKFEIDTNGKVVHATRTSYTDYLKSFKKGLISVHYDVQEYISSEHEVVVPFVINIKSTNLKLTRNLRVIAIFTFNDRNKIVKWQEVFSQIS